MLSRNKIKYLKQLQQKKYRNKYNCFVVEGEKLLKEAILQDRFNVEEIFLVNGYDENTRIGIPREFQIQEITPVELERISSFKNPHKALVVLQKQPEKEPDTGIFQEPVLYLDRIQDPGNLGTIMRTADWFGIGHIICSPDSVDAYNPKVIQASMGSVFRVQVWYASFIDVVMPLVNTLALPVYGTFLKGQNIYANPIESPSLIVLGNESQGISSQIEPYIGQQVYIPAYGGHSESLNVGVAAGIICSELRRVELRTHS